MHLLRCHSPTFQVVGLTRTTVALVAACLCLLLSFPPSIHAAPKDDDAQTQKRVGQQRTVNEKIYAENAVQLRAEHTGKWVVIVGGKLVTSFGSFHEADAAADKLEPNAAHRFIFRPGQEDQDVEIAMSPWKSGDPGWLQFGRQFQAEQKITTSAAQWIRNNQSHATPDGRGSFTLTTAGPMPKGKSPHLRLRAVISGLFEKQLTITEFDSVRLQLDRYAVPGKVKLAGFEHTCRKVRCRVSLDDLDVNCELVAFVIPDEIVGDAQPKRSDEGHVLSPDERRIIELLVEEAAKKSRSKNQNRPIQTKTNRTIGQNLMTNHPVTMTSGSSEARSPTDRATRFLRLKCAP